MFSYGFYPRFATILDSLERIQGLDFIRINESPAYLLSTLFYIRVSAILIIRFCNLVKTDNNEEAVYRRLEENEIISKQY